MIRASALWLAPCLLLAVGVSCGTETAPTPDPGAAFVFDTGANLEDSAHFFDMPYPSDLRLGADGHPDLAGFPDPGNVPLLQGLLHNAKDELGFPVIPVAHFRFTKPIAKRTKTDVIPASLDAPIFFIDIDPTSPEFGKLVPTVADTPAKDIYTPENLLSVAPRPGFVLRPGTMYGVVVMKSANDAAGKPLAPMKAVTNDAKAFALYEILWNALGKVGLKVDGVAAATVFTTAKTAQATADLGTKIVDAYDVTLDGLALVTDPNDQYAEFCYLKGTVTYPQFQTGTPPYDAGGIFEMGADGLPKKQRDEVAPIILLVPKMPMPAKGYPIMFNIHGSGGFSVAAVRPVADDGFPGDPIGPAFPITSKGIAVAGSAMPVNPERLPGASEIAYLNVNNIAAMRDTFRQGTFEQRLFMEAVKKLSLDPSVLGACMGQVTPAKPGPTLPAGETKIKFDPDLVLLTGQSMGGMYTNIIGATEPSVKAVVPTGGGGFWTHFIFETPLKNGAIPGLFKLVLATDTPDLNFMHPVFGIGAAALEAADPIIYMRHIAYEPLPGNPVRSVYRPVGTQDSYFAEATYDAVAIAYRHKQAGDVVWQTMQDGLALAGLGGTLPYSVEQEMTSLDGTPYTGVVAQFDPDGPYDGHAVYSHHDGVKHQYACFWDSFVKTGKARVPPPTKPWTAPCE